MSNVEQQLTLDCMDIAKVLILGRPNVGKSTLINRLIKRKSTITFDEPGVTRDLNEFLVTHNGLSFFVVDSGGILAEKNNEFAYQDQVEVLVKSAIFDMSVVVFMTDAQSGLLPTDLKIAEMLRKAVPEKVIVIANKADNDQFQETVHQFIKLGLGKPLPVSSIHGKGVTPLLDMMTKNFGFSEKQTLDLKNRFKVGLVGRPNVGKSSLLNALINTDYSIVDSKSGTTRDAIHVFFKHAGQTFEFIDTAGLRRKSQIKGKIEFYSSVRSEKSIAESDVCLLLVDAERGFCNQDKRIIQLILDAGKSMIVVVNKSDCLQEGSHVHKDFKTSMIAHMPVLEYYPVCFVSATQKDGLKTIFKQIPQLFEGIHERIQTKLLNDFNRDVIRRFPPPAKYGKQVKIYYLTQVETLPPTFICFINHKKYLTEDYRRFLEKRIRSYLGGFFGHTLRVWFKEHRDK